MNRFKEYLQKNHSLTEEEWNVLSEFVVLECFPKQEFFIEENVICRKSGFLLSGVMRYYTLDSEGNEPTCYFTFENHLILDPFHYKKQEPSNINLKSITECEIAVISSEKELELRKKLPRWEDICNAMLLGVSIEFANQKQMMVMNASERYEHFVSNYPQLASRVPLQYIASYLGIAQQSLSRLRKGK